MFHDEIKTGIAITAVFLMDGLRNHHMSELVDIWGQGYLELGQEIAQYAEFITVMGEEAAGEMDNNYPGVFEYEVTANFGKWFGEFIIENRKAPEMLDVCGKLKDLLVNFFSRGATVFEISALDKHLSDNRFKIGELLWKI